MALLESKQDEWEDIPSFITPNSNYIISNNNGDKLICKKRGNEYFIEASIFAVNRTSPPTITRSVNYGLLAIGTHSLNLTKRGVRHYCCLETNSSGTDPVPCILFLAQDGTAYIYLQTENTSKVYSAFNIYLTGSIIFEE